MILRIKKLHHTAQLSYIHNDSQSVRVCNITKVMLYFLRVMGLFLRLMLTIVLLSQQAKKQFIVSTIRKPRL